MSRDGKVAVFEVSEYVEGSRASLAQLSPALPRPMRRTFDVQSVEDGCLLIVGTESDAPEGLHWSPEQRSRLTEEIRELLVRVRQQLGAGS